MKKTIESLPRNPSDSGFIGVDWRRKLSNENPDARLYGEDSTTCKAAEPNIDNCAGVAPGEGGIPTSILSEKEWDIKTYPHLYPDGKNGMHAKRKAKLSNQQYLRQRLFNVDKRFANDSAYLFSTVSYIEIFQPLRNISMSFLHGSKVI